MVLVADAVDVWELVTEVVAEDVADVVAVTGAVVDAVDVSVEVAVTGHAPQLAGHLSLTFTLKKRVLHLPRTARSTQPSTSTFP